MAQIPHLDSFLRLAAARFQTLSDPSRLHILMVLKERGEVRATDLATLTGLSQPATSKHLGLLRQSGFVETRREGTSIIYRLKGDTVSALCELMCASLEQEHSGLTAALAAVRSPKPGPSKP